MQLPLDLMEAPAPLEHVFDGLPAEERTILVVALARLIAQAAGPQQVDHDE
ncbi:MAG: hypothetical protein NVS4B6_18990 [Mycobacterium sp.]